MGKKGVNLRKNPDKSRKNYQLFLFYCAAYAYTERRAPGVRTLNEALTDALTRPHLQSRAGGAPSQMRVAPVAHSFKGARPKNRGLSRCLKGVSAPFLLFEKRLNNMLGPYYVLYSAISSAKERILILNL